MVGLGNTGARYAGTRHNVGFVVAVAFAKRHGIALGPSPHAGEFGSGVVAGRETGVLLPHTMMNASGDAVAAALAAMPGVDPRRELLIVYDDLDLPPGRIRLRPRGGPGGQRGLASVLAAVGHEDVPRLRFGIGRPPPSQTARDYVLAEPAGDEAARLPARVAHAVDAIDHLLEHGIDSAMDVFNRAPSEEPPGPPAAPPGPVARLLGWLAGLRGERVR